MPNKKRKKYADEDDEEEEEELDREDDVDIDEMEEEDVAKEVKRLRKEKKEIETKDEEVKGSLWQLQHFPELFRIINPKTKEVILQAATVDELRLQLDILTAQNAAESAKNTR